MELITKVPIGKLRMQTPELLEEGQAIWRIKLCICWGEMVLVSCWVQSRHQEARAAYQELDPVTSTKPSGSVSAGSYILMQGGSKGSRAPVSIISLLNQETTASHNAGAATLPLQVD